jgi:hypothetical protein
LTAPARLVGQNAYEADGQKSGNADGRNNGRKGRQVAGH